MTPRLVPWPRAAAAVIAACVALVGGLGALVYHDTAGTAFDDAVDRWIRGNVSAGTLDALLQLTDPGLIIGLIAVVALGAALLRRWDVAALAVATPLLATVLTEAVLKPLVGRTNGIVLENFDSHTYAYPSGHETGVASLVAVLGLLLLRSGVRTASKVAGVVVLVAVLVLAAIALVGRFFHFATDTIGSVGLAVGCVLALGLLSDAVHLRVRERRAQLTCRS